MSVPAPVRVQRGTKLDLDRPVRASAQLTGWQRRRLLPLRLLRAGRFASHGGKTVALRQRKIRRREREDDEHERHAHCAACRTNAPAR
jgi:hypothetical protein